MTPNSWLERSNTIFGNVTVLFQRGVIVVYYMIALMALYAVEWQHFSWMPFLIVLYVGLWMADFLSGLVHLYIDYRPLNYEAGFDRIYDYAGPRDTEEFLTMKAEVVRKAFWFDHLVYTFKIHHRHAHSNRDKPYRDFFWEFALPASLFLFGSLAVSLRHSGEPWAAYLAVIFVIISIGSLHADTIHVWVHGSRSMPLGSKVVRFLQKYRLIYSYRTHALHHRDGVSGFCFVIGHANFAVDWICRMLLKRGVIHSEDWFGVRRHSV